MSSSRCLRRAARCAAQAVPALLALFAFAGPALANADNGTPASLRGGTTSRPYDSMAIRQPAGGATIFDNGGNVEVAIAISPALRVGDGIALSVDGRPVPQRIRTQFELSGIARGEHTLQARAVDRDGNTMISSAPVTFYMWRASRLFPNRRTG